MRAARLTLPPLTCCDSCDLLPVECGGLPLGLDLLPGVCLHSCLRLCIRHLLLLLQDQNALAPPHCCCAAVLPKSCPLRALIQIGRNGNCGSSHRPEPLQVWLFADHVLFWPNGCYVCSACNRLWKRWVPGCAGIRSPHLLWGKERLAGCIVPPVIGKSRVSERAEEGPVH